jgi:GDP-4-dehydro-6-deoxy-D-mannose reductase
LITANETNAPRHDLLVTGDSGFIGRHFRSKYGGVGFEDAEGPVDLCDERRVRLAVASIAPRAVLHLAAQSSVPDSVARPQETYNINFVGTLNLLQALQAMEFRGAFVYVSSADVYGHVEEEHLPVRETTPVRPRSPYAASKLAAEALCYQQGRMHGFRVVIVRPFNQIGPGQDGRFALPNFARQIAEIRAGRRPAKLVGGDLSTTRDFTDVRDTVRGLDAILERGRDGETYNLCSGRERSLYSMVTELLEIAGVEAELEVDPERLRPNDLRRMVGDAGKLREHTGWTAEIPTRTTLEDILSGEGLGGTEK